MPIAPGGGTPAILGPAVIISGISASKEEEKSVHHYQDSTIVSVRSKRSSGAFWHPLLD